MFKCQIKEYRNSIDDCDKNLYFSTRLLQKWNGNCDAI